MPILQKRHDLDRVVEQEQAQPGLDGGGQDGQELLDLIIFLELRIALEFQVPLDLLDDAVIDFEFFLKSIQNFKFYLVFMFSAYNFSKLGAQVRQKVRKEGDAYAHDNNGPKQLKIVGWRDVAIANCGTSHSGPVHSAVPLVEHGVILDPHSAHPVSCPMLVELRRGIVKTGGNVQHQ